MVKWKKPVFQQRDVRTETSILLKFLENPTAPRWQMRQDAIFALAKKPLTQEEQQALSELLVCILDRRLHEPFWRRIVRPFLQSLMVVLTVSGFMTVLLAVLIAGLPGSNLPPFFLLICIIQEVVILPFLLPFALAKDVRLDDFVRAAAAKVLGHLGDSIVLAPLADALSDSNHEVRFEASRSLLKRLLILLESPEFQLSAHTTTRLCRSFTRQRPEAILLSLRAIEIGGTSQAIPYLENLLKTSSPTDASEPLSVRETISRVLRVLYERKQREEQRERLVRSSESPSDAGLLLRPANSTEEAKEDAARLLVRAASDASLPD